MVPVSLLLALVTALRPPRLLPPAWRLAGSLLSVVDKSGPGAWLRLRAAGQNLAPAWLAKAGMLPAPALWGPLTTGGPPPVRRRLMRSGSQDLAPPY